MADKPYSNRELDQKFENLYGKLDEQFEAQNLVLADIKKDGLVTMGQAKLTNGRVNDLEKRQYGAMVGLSVVVVLLLPLLTWALSQLVGVDKQIDKALSSYEIEVQP